MNRVNKTNLKYIYIFHTSSRATLKETFTAKYIVVMPRTPYKVRPKSELTPLSETTNIPAPLIWESPPRDLNSVSNVCEAAPRSWFCAPNGLNELLEVGCAFPFILTGKSTVAQINSNLGTQVGAQNNDFSAVSQIDLTRALFHLRRRLSRLRSYWIWLGLVNLVKNHADRRGWRKQKRITPLEICTITQILR